MPLMMISLSCTTFEISSMAFAVSSTVFAPEFTFSMESSIRAEVSFAASALLAARLLTSSATTAKPFPASPALAASTAAFSARMLVWKAMSSMVLMILEIFSEDLLISCMAVMVSCICTLPRLTSSIAWTTRLAAELACSAFCFVFSAISSMEAVICWMALACSVEPWARAWLALAT